MSALSMSYRFRVGTDHCPKRPNVSCGIPRRFHNYFWASLHGCSDWRACLGVFRVRKIRAPKITQLDIREPDIPFSGDYEDIVKFNKFNLRFSRSLGEIPSNTLTCVYIAFFMEHLQCLEYVS